MAVAPSFQSLEKIMPPFIENGREYIYVICKNGNKRKVRWYADNDPKLPVKKKSAAIEKKSEFVGFKAHDAFGFGKDNYITIYDGNDYVIEEWRSQLPMFSVRQNGWFGYYSPSYVNVTPPPNVRAIKLEWQEIRRTDDDNCLEMKDGYWVLNYVNEKVYGHNVSTYQGQKDEWLFRTVTIIKNINTETTYGETHIHIMRDGENNEYVWTTATKNLEENKQYMLKMKVKEHKEYKGTKQTIVYYCRVI